MAKATNPTNISRAFSIAHAKLASSGVLDATLAIDTRLFIDPLLLESSSHVEMQGATNTLAQFFEKIISLLKASKRVDDPAWKAASRIMKFPEISGTCLGYGAGSIHGSGFGQNLSERILNLAAEIIDIGIEVPELFPAMALFEPDIGPDRISDMITNIIFDDIARFNERIIADLGLPQKVFKIKGKQYSFALNPCEANKSPIILLPTDILRDLPVAQDWDGIADAASQNDQLRYDVSTYVGEIWAKKTKRDKVKLKKQALSSKTAFQTLLTAINAAPHTPYPVALDPEGLNKWAVAAQEIVEANPLTLTKPLVPSADELKLIVSEIVIQFKHLIEHCGLNKELYKVDKTPRHESSAQRIFFAVAYSYCKSNDIDISPEIDTGTGKIDFKFSHGFTKRYLVEIKLSTNNSAVSSFCNQLEIYRTSQETEAALYLVLDVGKMGTKDDRLIKLRNESVALGNPVSELEFVDGTLKASASKRRN